MSDEDNIGDKGNEKVELLGTPFLRVSHKSNYGSASATLRGILQRIDDEAKAYLSEIEPLRKREAELLAGVPKNGVRRMDVTESAYDDYQEAKDELREVRGKIAELSNEKILPSVHQLSHFKINKETGKKELSGLAGYVQAADKQMNDLRLINLQITKWDSLEPNLQDYLFTAFSLEHKENYTKRLLAEYEENTAPISTISGKYEEKNSPHRLSERYSIEDFGGALPNKETGIDSVTGLPRAYKAFESKNSPEFLSYVQAKASINDMHISKLANLHSEAIELMMGYYPHKQMSEEQLAGAMNNCYAKLGAIVGIEVVTIVTGAKIATKLGEIGLTQVIKAGTKELSTKVATKMLSESGAETALKIGGGLACLVGGAAIELPISLILTEAAFGGKDVRPESYGVQPPAVSEQKLEELMNDKIYEGHNPLSKLLLWVGQDNAYNGPKQAPLWLGGEVIAGVDNAEYEAGLRGQNEEISQRLKMVSQMRSDYDAVAKWHYSQIEVERAVEKEAISPTNLTVNAADKAAPLAKQDIIR